MTEEEQVRKAQNAERITKDPIFQEALSIIKQSLHDKIENSDPYDTNGREECYRYLKIVKDVERHFLSVIQNGQIAQEKLNLLEKAKRLVKGRK